MSNELDTLNATIRHFHSEANGVFFITAVDHQAFLQLKENFDQHSHDERRVYNAVIQFLKKIKAGQTVTCSGCDRALDNLDLQPSIVVLCLPYAKICKFLSFAFCPDCADGDWEAAADAHLREIWPDMHTLNEPTEQ